MSGDFKSMSADIVKDFLQTVVVVDDETPLASQNTRPAKDEVVTTPGSPVSEERADSASEDESTQINTKDDQPHFLDARLVIDSFAQQGLVCSILQPDKVEDGEIKQGDESLVKRVLQVSRRSDLLVLDWEINNDHGDTATEIIKKIIAEDRENRQGSLRLIAIYTGEPDLAQISQKIARTLDIEYDDGEPVLSLKPAKIVVYAKEDVSTGKLGSFEDRRVAFEDLPQRLIEDFADMTQGLVPNAAVKSLSILRDNTHKLLSRLHSDLDAPYLVHRLFLPEPSDSSDFLVDLLVSELRAVLDKHGVGEHSSGKEIRAWIEEAHVDTTTFDVDRPRPRDDIISCLISTSDINLKNVKVSKQIQKFTDLTAQMGQHSDSKCAEKRNMEFAVLASIVDQHNHMGLAPKLTLGTIVEDITNDEDSCEYLLCIQPRCDSVRLGGEERTYPFLPYRRLQSGATEFDLILPEKSDYIRLKLLSKPFKIETEIFRPSSDAPDAVRASKPDGEFIFESENSTSKRRFRWVAELKREQAQRDILGFTSNMSRVGLDEFEWLRLSAPKRP